MGKHVFISYHHEDAEFAENVIYRIKDAGFISWVDSNELRAGEDWQVGIDQAIKNASSLIVIARNLQQESNTNPISQSLSM